MYKCSKLTHNRCQNISEIIILCSIVHLILILKSFAENYNHNFNVHPLILILMSFADNGISDDRRTWMSVSSDLEEVDLVIVI